MKVKVNGRNDGLIVRIGSCLIYPVRCRKNSKRSKKEGQRLPCDHHLSSHVLSHSHQPIFHQEFFSHTLVYFCFIVSIFLHCLPYFTD